MNQPLVLLAVTAFVFGYTTPGDCAPANVASPMNLPAGVGDTRELSTAETGFRGWTGFYLPSLYRRGYGSGSGNWAGYGGYGGYGGGYGGSVYGGLGASNGYGNWGASYGYNPYGGYPNNVNYGSYTGWLG